MLRCRIFTSLFLCIDANSFPNQVNECIISKAGVLFDCVSLEKKNFMFLRNVADYLKDVYGINTQDWGLVELAAALKMISDPGEDDPQKVHQSALSVCLSLMDLVIHVMD